MKSVLVVSTLAAGASAQFNPFSFASTGRGSGKNPFARNAFAQQQQQRGSGFTVQGSSNGISFSGEGLGGLINGLASLLGGAIGGGDAISNIPGCVDDATGDVKANGGSCGLLKNMFGCKKDLSTLSNKAQPGQLVEDVCPATCNTCGKAPTFGAAAAPSVDYPIYSAPSLPSFSPSSVPMSTGCVDDATGDVAARGASCSMLKGIFACSQDLSSFDARAPPGTTLAVVCPVTCNACAAATPASSVYTPTMQWWEQPQQPSAQWWEQPQQPATQWWEQPDTQWWEQPQQPAVQWWEEPEPVYFNAPPAANSMSKTVPVAQAFPVAQAPAAYSMGKTVPIVQADMSTPCVDDATGDVKANGGSCSLLKNLFGCKKDLSTLSNKAQPGQLVESVCPKTCNKC
jgi:hypothetical protein